MKKETQVVVLPFPAFGHMMPLYQLALALAESGVHVHYVATPKNISRLPKPPHTLSDHLHFVQFPMPVLDTCPFPVGAESTMDLLEAGTKPQLLKHLAMTYDLLQQPVKELVALLSPDWLIADLLAYWAVQIGREFNVPVLSFSPFNATTMLFFGLTEHLVRKDGKKVRSTLQRLTVPSPWVDFPSSVAYRKYEAFQALITVFTGENSISDKISKSLEGCESVIFRSCDEFEGEYLRAFAKGLGKSVIRTGLLMPEPTKQINFTDKKWIDTFRWLATQKKKSITFVGFGSECRLKQQQVHEIARGLQLSGLPFLWSLRRPIWASEDDENLFPPNFIQNTCEQGKVCIGWAPQMEILAHPSVGASLFHSGWGSVIETIQFEHRLIVLPFLYDQSLNARLLVEKGMAIEVERGEDGSFNGEGIAKALKRAIMVGDGADRLREAAIIANDRELQTQYMDKFVEFLNKGLTNDKKISFSRM